jgi:hypothetical protein
MVKPINESRVTVTDFVEGTWTDTGRYRLRRGMLLGKNAGTCYLAYIGVERIKFLTEEVRVEIEEQEYLKGIDGKLHWSYFEDKYMKQ